MSPRRFPFPHPLGWFAVAAAGEVAPGTAVSRRYWSRELVLWRDADGGAHLQDAWCPHLGAHLGVGGTVDGDELVCPFHGWRFDGGGACTRIPYSERVNRKARLRTYPVVERNGFVFAWYHPSDEPPTFEIPVVEQLGDPGWTDVYPSEHVIATVPQEMSENGVDPAHFKFVHGTETIAEVVSYDTDGPCSTMLSRQSYVTPKGTEWGRIDVFNYGPGFSKVCFEIPGVVEAINLATTTPIDFDSTRVGFNFIVRRHDDERFTNVIAEAFVAEINKQIVEDRPIWEHKTFLPVPALADNDGPIARFRRWYGQFYAEPYVTGASTSG